MRPPPAPRPIPTVGSATGAPMVGPPAHPRPEAPPSPWRRVRAPLLVGGAVAAMTLALHLRDPHAQGSWGECPWLALTGLYCPGCGGLRAVNDLTDGDVLGALSSNVVFVVLVPVLVLWWALWTRRAWAGQEAPAAPRGRATVLVGLAVLVTVVFTVLRNTPFGSWLAP